MTAYNKLKIAILAIISSQHLYAITLDPIQIQSAPGELLYAEMSFHQADANSKLDVSLATPEDLLMIGAAHQPPSSLNFFTRRNNQGEGVIVITSTRPMTDAELNIILKIQEGGASHLKHIRQPMRQVAKAPLAKNANEKSLTPKFIVSEKDIALNLPESTRFNVANSNPQVQSLKQETLLNAPFTLPPVLETPKATATAAVSASAVSIVPPVKVETTTAAITSPMPQPAKPVAEKVQQQPKAVPLKQEMNQTANATTTAKQNAAVDQEQKAADLKTLETKEKNKAADPVKQTVQATKKKTPSTTPSNDKAQQHVVQRNESLWSIAQHVAAQTQQPVAQVMNQIKAQNEHAFIGGNANRLRQGSHLNFNLAATSTQQNKNTNQIATQTQRPTAGKAKYRLQQAEMSLLAESNQDSSTGSAKKDTLQQKTSADLSLKVMTAREKTVTLQRNVTQLELALRQKEQRIQLLNARLAELQDQLKAQQDTKKPTR